MIKVENGKWDQISLYLIDYGLSIDTRNSTNSRQAGTTIYESPELGRAGIKSDMYSVGILVIAFLSKDRRSFERLVSHRWIDAEIENFTQHGNCNALRPLISSLLEVSIIL